jgi:hypothetical protein
VWQKVLDSTESRWQEEKTTPEEKGKAPEQLLANTPLTLQPWSVTLYQVI